MAGFAVPILTAVAGADTIASTAGAIQQGNAARRASNFQASQMEQKAGQERATAQRAAIAEEHKATLAGSRLIATAGASGAAAADPTVSNILGDIRTQGEYNALSALYNGEERARGLEMGAEAQSMQGQQAKTASTVSAFGSMAQGTNTLLAGGAGRNSLLMKYSSPDELPWMTRGNVNPSGGFY